MRRLGRVLASHSAHLKQLFGAAVPRLQHFVPKRPRGRNAIPVFERREVAFAVADQATSRSEGVPSTPRSQRASVAGQARTMAVALPRQTMASAARGAPIQLPYKQKIPREPRTRATPNNATRDRRSAKLMLSILRQTRRSTPVPKRAAGPRRHWLTTY